MPASLHPAHQIAHESGHHRSRMVERQTVLVAIVGQGRIAGGRAGRIVLAEGDGDGADDDAGWAGQWIASRISNIAQDACELSSPLPLARGMAVRIMLPGFEGRPAHVVAVGEGVARCIFATPLPTAILDYIVRMSDPAARG